MQSGSQRGAAAVFTSNRVTQSPSGKVFFKRNFLRLHLFDRIARV
jgi:hypothetical protein